MPLLPRVFCRAFFAGLALWMALIVQASASMATEMIALPGVSPQTGGVQDYGLIVFTATTIVALIVYIWRRTIKDVDAFRPYVDMRIDALLGDMHEQQVEFMARLAHIDQSQEENLRREQYAHKEWVRAYEETQRQLANLIARVDRLLERG
mgnify:CR=1 FL=1